MIRIINGTDIQYTKGDTFRLTVSSKNSFNEGSQLRFVVARNEESDNIINKTFDLNGEGVFVVSVNETEREEMQIGNYLYKFILIAPDGTIITQKSGDFIVKWGA